MPKKKSHPFGISPEEVKRSKRRRSAKKMTSLEKGVTKDVKRGERIARGAKAVAETGGLRGRGYRGFQNIQKGLARLGGDTTQAEAIKRGQWRAARKREKGRAASDADRLGLEHTSPYEIPKRAITGTKRTKRGGTVSRNMGGKIMYGYKAGGKV